MKVCLKLKVILPFLVAIVAVLMFGNTAFGQCSMCRAALGGSNNAFFIRNFNIGVLVLLVPPVAIFCSMFVVLRRYKVSDEQETEKKPTWSSPDPQ